MNSRHYIVLGWNIIQLYELIGITDERLLRWYEIHLLYILLGTIL